MPWSPWITDGYLYDLPADYATVEVDLASGQRTVYGRFDLNPQLSDQWQTIMWYDGTQSLSFTSQMGTVSVLGDGWETNFEVYPAALWDLQEGVDFTIRPDRTYDDPDCYVEYLPGAAISFAGWRVPPMTVHWQSLHDTNIVSGTGRVALVATDGRAEAWPGYGAGQALAQYPLDNATSVNVPVPEALVQDIGPAVTLVIQDSANHTFPPPPPTGNWVWSRQSSITQQAGATWPGAQGFMPPYRYWIPGLLPLRQVQRDDGLARSVVRATGGHSRQSSLRARGFL